MHFASAMAFFLQQYPVHKGNKKSNDSNDSNKHRILLCAIGIPKVLKNAVQEMDLIVMGLLVSATGSVRFKSL